MREPRVRLRDILDAIDAIERYAHRGRGAFDGDELVQTWILRQLQIIGEAARAVPEDLRRRAPDIPWSKIIGMRNVLVHGYFDRDAEIVWQVVQRDLPSLRNAVERLLAELGEPDVLPPT